MDNIKQSSELQSENGKKKLKWWGILLIVFGSLLLLTLIGGTVASFVLDEMYTEAFYSEEVEFVERPSAYVEEKLNAEELEYVPYELIVEVPNTTYIQNSAIDRSEIVVKMRYFDGEKTLEAPVESWWLGGGINETIKTVGSGEMNIVCNVVVAGSAVTATVNVPIEVVEKTDTRPAGNSFNGTAKFTGYTGSYGVNALDMYSEETLESIERGFVAHPIYKKEQINKDVVNFLVIGSGDTDDGRLIYHAETMIVVSYNKKNDTLKAVSLLRDTLVPIEGYGWNKLQVAYRIGGPGLLINTINEVYGLDIQYYVRSDIDKLIGLLDAVGGVELEVTQDEIDRLALEDVLPGNSLLTGKNLYNWIVFNGAGAEDVTRTARQSKVIKQLILDYAKGDKNVMEFVELCTEHKCIITNMPFSKFSSNLLSLVIDLIDIEYSHSSLPVNVGDPYGYACYKKSACGINIPTAELKKMMARLYE